MVGEVAAFAEAVGKAVDFASRRPGEALIVVTSDHETGGLSFDPYSGRIETIENQQVSFEYFSEHILDDSRGLSLDSVFELAYTYFGLSDFAGTEIEMLDSARRRRGRGAYHPLTTALTSIVNDRAGLSWSTEAHTGAAVPVYAYGAGHRRFEGRLDNTDIFGHLRATTSGRADSSSQND